MLTPKELALVVREDYLIERKMYSIESEHLIRIPQHFGAEAVKRIAKEYKDRGFEVVYSRSDILVKW